MSLWPGLLRAAMIAWVAFLLAGPTSIDGAAWAIVIAIAIGQWQAPTASEGPGLQFASKTILLLAIAFLGARIRVSDLADGGVDLLALAIIAIASALLASFLFGRLFGLPPGLWMSLGVGTGICGAAAVAATRTATGAKDEEVAISIATITLLGTIGMLALPALQILQWFSEAQFGQWMGASLHAVPQALAAGFAGGGNVGGRQAGLVKMTRVALLPIVAIALARSRGKRGTAAVPHEVLWFVGLFVLSIGLSETARAVVIQVDKLLFLMAFAAIGSQVRWQAMVAARKAVLAGAAVWGVVLFATAAWLLV